MAGRVSIAGLVAGALMGLVFITPTFGGSIGLACKTSFSIDVPSRSSKYGPVFFRVSKAKLVYTTSVDFLAGSPTHLPSGS